MISILEYTILKYRNRKPWILLVLFYGSRIAPCAEIIGSNGICAWKINEAPVLAPRMKQELEPGMVFALEPKIVLPGVGPLGIENSWVVTADGVEKLTLCKEEIIEM